jgi:hypothetical protein
MRKRSSFRGSCLAVLALILWPMLSACGVLGNDLEYAVRAANYTNQGVILLNFPVARPSDEADERRGVYPGVPGVAGAIISLGTFSGHPHSLPDYASVTWQMAELTDCDIVRHYKSRVEGNTDPKIYARKINCDWTPLEGQVFTQQLDMDAIRNSEAYRVAADPPPGSFLRGQPTLRIDLIFHDSGLEVRTSRGRLLGFMQ